MKNKLSHKIMDLLLDTVCAVDVQGRFVYVSASCVDLFGYTQEELQGRVLFELVHPDDQERTRLTADRVADGEPIMHFENRYIHKDGHTVDVMWSARWSETDQLRLAVARDVTSLKQAQRTQDALYRISEAGQTAAGLPTLCKQIHAIIDVLLPIRNFSVVLYDREQDTTTIPYCVGDVSCVMGGSTCGALPPTQPPSTIAPDSPFYQVLRSGAPLLTTVVGPAGASREWLGVPLCASRGVIGALVIQGGPNTAEYTHKDRDLLQFVSTQIAASIERKQIDTQLRHMAGHDSLTDLPNRNLFHDRLEVALARARRDSEYLAVLYLDLDDFKLINDRYGHQAGDQVLCEVAKRIAGCLRESDTVARMGGDEFTVLLVNIRGPDCVSHIVNKIDQALAQPFEIGAQRLTVSASTGSALYPDQGHDFAQLLNGADAQMYRAKAHKPPVSA